MRLDKERLAARLEGHKEGIVQTDQIRYNGVASTLTVCLWWCSITHVIWQTVEMTQTFLRSRQIPVRGYVSGENRCHQSQDHGQETFHHQNRPG